MIQRSLSISVPAAINISLEIHSPFMENTQRPLDLPGTFSTVAPRRLNLFFGVSLDLQHLRFGPAMLQIAQTACSECASGASAAPSLLNLEASPPSQLLTRLELSSAHLPLSLSLPLPLPLPLPILCLSVPPSPFPSLPLHTHTCL